MRIPGRSKGSVSTQQTIDSTFGKLPVVMKMYFRLLSGQRKEKAISI